MDWEMPIMNGLECSRELRSLERTGDVIERTKIIAVTANVRKEQVDTALAAGIDEVMSKPFVVSELLEMVKKHVGR